MKRFEVYSNQLNMDFKEQEPNTLAICDGEEEALKLCREFQDKTDELVRVREVNY